MKRLVLVAIKWVTVRCTCEAQFRTVRENGIAISSFPME